MVTLNYARQVEQRVNDLLAQGNIEGAQRQAENITGGGAGVTNAANRISAAISAANEARVQVQDSQRQPAETGGGDDDGAAEAERERVAAAARDQAQRDYEDGLRREAERVRVANVVTVLNGVMNEYGLGDLMGQITQWVQSGLDGDAVMAQVRESEAYARRFPAMRALRAKGRTIDEASYIEFERRSAQLERSYGLPAGMLDQATVTRLLENEVSLNELEERVTMAAVGAYSTSDEIKRQFENFYGIGPGGLTAYFLDPERAMPLLNKQYASAQIGAEAQMQGVMGVGRETAEELTGLGVTAEAARQGFGRVRAQQGLTAGRGDVVNQDQLIGANLMGQEAAQRDVERAAMSRAARFEGGGGLQTQQTGVRALESSMGT